MGDFFYDTDDCSIYQKTDTGWTFISNIKGDAGANGSAWITGSTVTGTGSSITANVANARIGDLYLNNTGSDAGNLYKCIADNTWEYITNINGQDGISQEGQKGDRGSTWLVGALVTGTGASISQEVEGALVGDLYLNNTGADAGNLYRCTAEDTWEYITNINGQDGETPNAPTIEIKQGNWFVDGKDMGPAVGKDGTVVSIIDGEWALDGQKKGVKVTGERGSLWLTGDGVPGTIADVNAKDMYLDTKNNAIYQYNGTTWDLVTTLSTTSEVLENYYYSVSTGDQLEDLIEEGVQCFKLTGDIVLNEALVPTTDMSFDLNNFTLSYEGADRMEIHANKTTPINVEFKNGKINFNNTQGSSTIVVDTKCSVTMHNVDYVSNTTALFPRGDTAKVEIISSRITANGFAVGTNASLKNGVPEYSGIKIMLKDSVLTTQSTDFDNTAVMINVPGTLNIDGCELIGDKQALIARGGNTVVKNSKLVCTGEFLNVEANANYKYQPARTENPLVYQFTTAWDTGNAVPSAALVVGNYYTGAYQYVTNIEIENTEITSKRFATPKIVAIGNANEENAPFIGANIQMSNMQFSEDFLFTTILGENLNIRTMGYYL